MYLTGRDRDVLDKTREIIVNQSAINSGVHGDEFRTKLVELIVLNPKAVKVVPAIVFF